VCVCVCACVCQIDVYDSKQLLGQLRASLGSLLAYEGDLGSFRRHF
jgi:hypothetical protein